MPFFELLIGGPNQSHKVNFKELPTRGKVSTKKFAGRFVNLFSEKISEKNLRRNRTLLSLIRHVFDFRRRAVLGGSKENSFTDSVNIFSEDFLDFFRRKTAERTELLASFRSPRCCFSERRQPKGRGTCNGCVSHQVLFWSFSICFPYNLRDIRLTSADARAVSEFPSILADLLCGCDPLYVNFGCAGVAAGVKSSQSHFARVADVLTAPEERGRVGPRRRRAAHREFKNGAT